MGAEAGDVLGQHRHQQLARRRRGPQESPGWSPGSPGPPGLHQQGLALGGVRRRHLRVFVCLMGARMVNQDSVGDRARQGEGGGPSCLIAGLWGRSSGTCLLATAHRGQKEGGSLWPRGRGGRVWLSGIPASPAHGLGMGRGSSSLGASWGALGRRAEEDINEENIPRSR